MLYVTVAVMVLVQLGCGWTLIHFGYRKGFDAGAKWAKEATR